MPSLQATRSAIGAAVRRGDPQAEADARREHAANVLEKHIPEVLATAPPLTNEQLDRLAALLRPAMRRAGA